MNNHQQQPNSGSFKPGFVFLSLPRHDGAYTSTPWQLARELSLTDDVVFIDHPFTFLDVVKGFWKPQIRKRITAYWKQSCIHKDGVHVVYAPFVFPVNFLPKGKIHELFLRFNQKILAHRVNKALKALKIDRVIYVNSFNFYFPELQANLKVEAQQVIYHCIDPMVKAFTLKHGKYLQERAARNSNFVICTAPALQKQFEAIGIKTFLVPNAANFELFKAAAHQPVHPSVVTIQGKVFGYLGNIERRTDFSLLLSVVEALHDWHLVLAGPVERQYVPVEFFNHPRIHFTGPVKHDQAPAVLQRFDVCIIPFKCDEVSNGIYPLKLFEYLATGKPVVSTNFNEEILRDLKDVVHVAHSVEDFFNQVLLAYTTDSLERSRERVSVASENTWASRARLFKSISSIELKNKSNINYVA